MRSRTILALAGTSAVAAAVAGGALARPQAVSAHGGRTTGGASVTVRIEGARKTLLLATSTRGRSGSITKYGAPQGKCPGQSAQGALDVATHGDWTGKWYSSYNEYFITSILGEKPSGSDYWEIFVNHRVSSAGACDIKLRAGEQLLFADTNGKDGVSQIKAPHSAIAGTSFTVKLVGWAAHGAAKPLAGVKITGNGIRAVKTNSQGVARIKDDRLGRLILRASPDGYIRAEAEVRLAHR